MSATIFETAMIKALRSSLNLNDSAYVLTGSDDPTSVAKSAPIGSIYMRVGASGGNIYRKTDAGSSTNWTTLANAAYTQGQVVFGSGTASTSDSNLFWDNTNKRLGINTSSPSAPFQIKTESGYTEGIRLQNNGGGGSNGTSITWYSNSKDLQCFIRQESNTSGNGSSLVFAVASGDSASTCRQTMKITATGVVETGEAGYTADSSTKFIVAGTSSATPTWVQLCKHNTQDAGIYISTRANVARWVVKADTTSESGSNVGSDFRIMSYDDSGSAINTAIYIKRSTARVWFPSATTTGSAANAFLDSNNEIQKSTSLLQYKTNVQDLVYLDEVDLLRPVTFNSLCESDDKEKQFIGLIAEEVEQSCPSLATYENGVLQGVDYGKIGVVLISAFKKMKQEIQDLKSRIETLEGES